MATTLSEAFDFDEWVVWIKRLPDADGNEPVPPLLAYSEKAPSFDAAVRMASKNHRDGFREKRFQIVLVALKQVVNT